MNARAAAARILLQVVGEGRSLTTALPQGLEKVAVNDRPLVQNLCYGVLRGYSRWKAVIRPLLKHPFKPRDCDIELLLLIGAYQLLELKTPPHAAINESVAATRVLNKAWAKGVVNGVLRNLQRRADELVEAADGEPEGRYSHPRWLLERLQAAWPTAWEGVVTANNSRPPMVLRVDTGRVGRDDYLLRLADSGVSAEADPRVPSAVRLVEPVDVGRLPGFAEGEVSVQDSAAQLAASLLRLAPGQRVLDACAAPGGKTGHLLELEPRLAELVAIDSDEVRLQRVEQNLARLRRSASLLAADAGEPARWWDGRPFERILLDAPCSATGVIRRHPDIKWLRRAEDIETLVDQQRRLLKALWPLLAGGGMLLYATCSILPAENSDQIGLFLARHSDAREVPIEAGWGRAQPHGRQILPGDDGMDGFYYALLEKRPA